MNKEKLIKQLFIGKVAEIIGDEKAGELLSIATREIEKAIDYQDVIVLSGNGDTSDLSELIYRLIDLLSKGKTEVRLDVKNDLDEYDDDILTAELYVID